MLNFPSSSSNITTTVRMANNKIECKFNVLMNYNSVSTHSQAPDDSLKNKKKTNLQLNITMGKLIKQITRDTSAYKCVHLY